MAVHPLGVPGNPLNLPLPDRQSSLCRCLRLSEKVQKVILSILVKMAALGAVLTLICAVPLVGLLSWQTSRLLLLALTTLAGCAAYLSGNIHLDERPAAELPLPDLPLPFAIPDDQPILARPNRRAIRNRLIQEIFGPALPFNPLPIIQREASNPFETIRLGRPVHVLIASYLNARELFQLMRVSREFKKIATDNFAWVNTLQANRIHGPTNFWRRAFPLQEESPLVIAPALSQLRTFLDGSKPRSPYARGFLNQLMRLYPKGPTAFCNLPQLPIASLAAIKNIQPEEMSCAVMQGIVSATHYVLLIRLIDHAVAAATPFVLAFVSAKHRGGIGDFVQIPNAYWPERNLLRVDANDIDNRYMLRVIRGEYQFEDLPDNNPRIRKQVRLVEQMPIQAAL